MCLLLVLTLQVEGDFMPTNKGVAKGVAIVKFAPETNFQIYKDKGIVLTGIPSIDRLNKQYGVTTVRKLFSWQKSTLSNIYRFTFNESIDVKLVTMEYEKVRSVIYAEPDYIAQTCKVPNDSLFWFQWGLLKIQSPKAWDVETGDSSVIIAILDTGVNTKHPDLEAHIWVNEDEVPNNSLDDDYNGFVDDIHGWNFLYNNNQPLDSSGHGTSVAGIVAAVTNNHIGIAGVDWGAKIMALRVLKNNGQGLYSDIAEAIVYAADNGARVINLSLGAYFYSQVLEEAISYAYPTSVMVGAAGNDNNDVPFYPAYFYKVLAVAATEYEDRKCEFSNYGNWIDLSAPGVGIWTTDLNGYRGFTGTSAAAPFVSGVAALISSYESGLYAGTIMNKIINTADSIDSLNPFYIGKLGSGRLNAYSALTHSFLPWLCVYDYSIKDNGNGIPEWGEKVEMIVVLQNNGMDVSEVCGNLHTNDKFITVYDSVAEFGDIFARDRVSNGNDPYIFKIANDCPPHNILFELYITGDYGAYQDTLEFRIGTHIIYNLTVRPNPFVNFTLVSYQLPGESKISLKVYDITGRLVRRLVEEKKNAGWYYVGWHGTDDYQKRLPSGMYFIRLETPNYRIMKKVVLLH